MTTTSLLRDPADATGSWRRHLVALLVMGLVGGLIIGTLLGLTVGPKTPTLGEDGTGDPALVADVRAVLVNDRGYHSLSVGRVRGGQVAFAGLGSDRDGPPTSADPVRAGLDHQDLHRHVARRRRAAR